MKALLFSVLVFFASGGVCVHAILYDLSDSFVGPNEEARQQPEYVHYKSAQQYYISGDLKKAKAAYQESLKSNPNFFPSLIGLAEIADQTGYRQKADQFFQEAFAIKRDSALINTAYGKFLFKNKDIEQAKQRFETALEINPAQPQAHAELAVLYLGYLDSPEKAIVHYQKAIEVDPDNNAYLYGLSAAYAAKDDVDSAVSTLSEVAKNLPDNPMPWFYMGVYESGSGRYSNAIQHLTESKKRQPDRVETRWLLGDTYFQANAHEQALKEYQWIIQNDQEGRALAYFKQGIIHHLNGDYAGAETAYQESIKVNPNMPDPYNNLANISFETGKGYEQSLAWAQQALQLNPNSAVYLDTLGWIYYHLENYENARDTLLKAVELDPSLVDANYHLGKVYEKLNDEAQSKRYLENAKKLSKSSASGH